MSYVYAKSSTSVRWEGGVVRLVEGEVWDATDPLVRARSELFGHAPSLVRNTTGREVRRRRADRPVERATRAPGEKRGPVR